MLTAREDVMQMGQEVPVQPPGLLAQVKATWDGWPEWKRQAVVAGFTSAMTFFWMTKLHRRIFGK